MPHKMNLDYLKVVPGRGVTLLPELPWASHFFLHFLAKLDEPKLVPGRAARWVLSRYNRQDSVTDMLNELGWRSLQSRRTTARFSLLVFASLYKFRNNFANVDNTTLYPITYSSTRSSGQAYMTLNL